MPTGRTVRLTDPGAMRALAHPLRLRLLGELRLAGPSTVGMLSETVDESPANVSYHLGTLARHGFVVEVPERARDRRERWWAAAHDTTSRSPVDARDDPEQQAASAALRRAILDHYSQTLQAYLELEPSLGREWVRGTSSSDSHLHLTATELQELRAELEALAARWAARSDPDREGAEVVTLMYHAFRRPS
jgi:DNA-binding transcriptional ArsR family regulator